MSEPPAPHASDASQPRAGGASETAASSRASAPALPTPTTPGVPAPPPPSASGALTACASSVPEAVTRQSPGVLESPTQPPVLRSSDVPDQSLAQPSSVPELSPSGSSSVPEVSAARSSSSPALSASRLASVPVPRDLVVLYAPPWHEPTRFSKHHLASFFAAHGSRVLYVEAPLQPLGLRRGRAFVRELARLRHGPTAVGERLWVTRHFVPIPYHAATRWTSSRLANRLGQRLLAPRLRADLQRLGFASPVLIAGLPHAVDALPGLRWTTLVYHCADDYAHMRGFPSTLPQLEAELCRRADLVVTTSERLAQTRRLWNPRTVWVPNGADVEHFGQVAGPAPELASVGRPVIGFIGGLSQWIDVELLATLAVARPDWSLVLIGPLGSGIDVAPLRRLPNVHLLGSRPYASLPSYLAAFDVALIPFTHDPVTAAADPIKVYEYLAAGVPVVATDLPALRRLAHVVRLADSPAAFVAQVEAAVHAGRQAGRAARQAEAARHSWSSRFERLAALLQAAQGVAPGPACAS